MNSSNNSHSSDTGAIPAFLSKGEPTRTVIGAESNFMGDVSIRAGQDLHIEGCVLGNVFHGGRVVIADTGIVIGSIFAAHLEIHGVVDAPEGEILAANLVVHGTSRVTASEVTVTAGCMNYERGGYMSAQMGMLTESEVSSRIETLLQKELDRAQERRVAIEQTRNAARDLREARVAAAPQAAPAAAASAAAELTDQAVVSESAVAQAPAAPAPVAAPLARPAMALVPSIVEPDDSDEAREPARAYAG
ncbi:polymer-forming cytoskeletal protein [Variovorax sp. LjRoot290]|uniref:bactofilin family protein n=1 Tax=Variovorax sp. LjRoot290 TaxID=3342316 RepID=UPI003ED1127B